MNAGQFMIMNTMPHFICTYGAGGGGRSVCLCIYIYVSVCPVPMKAVIGLHATEVQEIKPATTKSNTPHPPPKRRNTHKHTPKTKGGGGGQVC